jgi:oxygen-independent coproporphyrinogen-3 oxidase
MQDAGIKLEGRDRLCGYCNLYTTVAPNVPPEFVTQVTNEIDMYKQIFEGRRMSPTSLYFGGGTPSLLAVEDIGKILTHVKSLFGEFPQNTEITIETSPDTVTAGKLKAIKDLGFNRVSVGVESFDPGVLSYTGRDYNPKLGYDAVKAAMKTGFSCVNGDLIAGLSTATKDVFLRDVALMLQLSPNTITVYEDMTRPLTRFGKMAEHGILPSVSQVDIYDWIATANEMLEKKGYVRDSLTCWTRDGSGYKQGEDIYSGVPIIGFGPSARSYGPNAHYATEYVVNTSLTNLAIHKWRECLQRGDFPQFEAYLLTQDIKTRKSIILGLMSKEGLNLKTLGSHFNPELQALMDAGMAQEKDGILHYTQRGKAYSGAISKLFFGPQITEQLREYEPK